MRPTHGEEAGEIISALLPFKMYLSEEDIVLFFLSVGFHLRRFICIRGLT